MGHPYSSDESGQSGYPSHLRRSLMHDPSLHVNSLSAHTGGPSVHKHNKTTVTGYTWSKQVCGCLSHFQFQTVMFLFNNREFVDTIEYSRCGIRDEPKIFVQNKEMTSPARYSGGSRISMRQAPTKEGDVSLLFGKISAKTI